MMAPNPAGVDGPVEPLAAERERKRERGVLRVLWEGYGDFFPPSAVTLRLLLSHLSVSMGAIRGRAEQSPLIASRPCPTAAPLTLNSDTALTVTLTVTPERAEADHCITIFVNTDRKTDRSTDINTDSCINSNSNNNITATLPITLTVTLTSTMTSTLTVAWTITLTVALTSTVTISLTVAVLMLTETVPTLTISGTV